MTFADVIAGAFFGGWMLCMVIAIPLVVGEDEKPLVSITLWLLSPFQIGFILLDLKRLTEKE